MRRILALILILSVFAGCGYNIPDDTSGDKLSVVTTIFPPYDFVRELAADRAELQMLLSPGTESHSYEPTPQDIITIQSCDIFIYVGGESDSWVDEILDSMDTDSMEILALLDLINLVEEEVVEGMEADEDPDDEAGAEYDEHVWTSPKNAKLIVQAISDALCGADRAGAEIYRENAEAYIEKLDGLDASFRDVVDNAARSTIVFGDRFPFRYLADDYGLTYYGAFPGCSSETEASAATIAFLIDKINGEDIPIVFYIEFSNEKIADTLCESTGAGKLLLHSCHNISASDFEGGVGYLELMYQNVENLREALK